MLRAFGLALMGLGVAGGPPARAQSAAAEASAALPASLIADRVTYDRASGILVASGNVEVLYQGRVLRAQAITYDEKARQIRATGPIQLTGESEGVILAGDAVLSPDIRDGLIESAQVLIAGKLQMAATEVRRSEGRYTTLYRTVASSCVICEGSPTPTWALRASRVTQDEFAKRIYFENATLELYGLPVGYLPRMSIPDPSQSRASGVLVPVAQHSDIYGFGFKLPYYRVISPYADMTLTPFLTTTGGKLMEGEYRQRFANGGFDFDTVVAADDGLGGTPGRGVAYAKGAFALSDFGLGAGFISEFDLALASDESFLRQFDYSDTDLLTSKARIKRTREDDYVALGTMGFQSLRDEETDTVPFILPVFTYRHLTETPDIGGRMGVDLNSLGVIRQDGADAFRIGGGVDWQRGWTLPSGVLASAGAGAGVDIYQLRDDPDQANGALMRADPNISVELRWPLARGDAFATHVIEPIAQVIYSDTFGDEDVPNNDSTLIEFDETNLFSLNRFPGQDRVETGLRTNVGVSYTRYDPAGWSAGVTVGRVFRLETDERLYESSGLAGRSSDTVAALALNFGSVFSVVNRALFDTDLTFNRNEFVMNYEADRGALRAAYVYLAAGENPYYGAQPETNEFGLDARYRVLPNWQVRGLWRYDVATGANLRAGGGLTYGNECAEFDLSVSRRYTSSTNVPPSTSFGFSVRLAGLGGSSGHKWPERVCVARKT